MTTQAGSPLVHLHISDSALIQVHVKSQRSGRVGTPQGKAAKLHPTAKVKTRVPWIPSGKASILETSYKWEGPTHCLEITQPVPDPDPEHTKSALQLADLISEEEEPKIHSLLTEVSSLKNEVGLRKKEQLSVSQQAKLSEMTKELEERLEETDYNRLDGDSMQKDALLRKLAEAEEDRTAAAKQVSALRGPVSTVSVAGGSRLSSGLARQEELLLQKLETFEVTNRTLRWLLREQQAPQMESEQKDTLLKRLTDAEAENAHLVVKLQDKDREVNQLSRLLDAEKDNIKSTVDLSKSLKSTQAHLQGQLRGKEAANNRLTVQIKNLERAANQQQAEKEHLSEQLARLKQQARADREALKQAMRAQKQRTERSEGTAGQLSTELQDMERQLADALSAAETWQSRHSQEAKDKNKLEIDASLLKSRAAELTEQLHTSQEEGRAEREALLDQVHELTTESTAAQLENQALQATASAAEEKLALSHSELQQVKASITQYESLIDSYKIQVGKTRAEADEYCGRLAQVEQDAQVVHGQLDQDIEDVRRELLARLAELEPLPEALRLSELQLQEAQDKERSQERRSVELSTTLSDVRMKVETQGSQMELLRRQNKVLMEENRQLQQRMESLERKLEDTGSQNGDLLAVIAKREEIIRSNQLRLDQKTRECSLLSGKLEDALDDARQKMSESREFAAAKEHSIQSKIFDQETQLSRTTSEINQLRCSKEEVEQRYRGRLQNMEDRLEQSDRTNRSLQNYVQFLKASYTNILD